MTLQQLINISFLEEQVKNEVISKMPSLTDDQKMALEELCWKNLIDWFSIKYEAEKEKMMLQMAQGDAEYKPEDFEAAKDKLLTELLVKISEVKTNDELAAVKQQLKEKLTPQAVSEQQAN